MISASNVDSFSLDIVNLYGLFLGKESGPFAGAFGQEIVPPMHGNCKMIRRHVSQNV